MTRSSSDYFGRAWLQEGWICRLVFLGIGSIAIERLHRAGGWRLVIERTTAIWAGHENLSIPGLYIASMAW